MLFVMKHFINQILGHVLFPLVMCLMIISAGCGSKTQWEYRTYIVYGQVQNDYYPDFRSKTAIPDYEEMNKLGEEGWEKPDLIIIDGGKGQLSSVMQIVEELGITGIDIVSLAKREEEVFLPNKSKSIIIPRGSSALFLIQRVRDEAHRFAITYHRNLRSTALKNNY